MSTVQEIKAAIPKLTPREQVELREWLEDFFEDQLELNDEVKTKLASIPMTQDRANMWSLPSF